MPPNLKIPIRFHAKRLAIGGEHPLNGFSRCALRNGATVSNVSHSTHDSSTRPSCFRSTRSLCAQTAVLMAFVFASAFCHAARQPAVESDGDLELAGFRTVQTAIAAAARDAGSPRAAGQSGYLGVHIDVDRRGRLVVDGVGPNSAAARAGVQVGDVLLRLDRKPVNSPEQLRDMLQIRSPGEKVWLIVERNRKKVELSATLDATSRPKRLSPERAILGVTTGDSLEDGVPVRQIRSQSPAEKAGLKTGDLVLRIDGLPVGSTAPLTDILAERSPGETVMVIYRRNGEDAEAEITLGADSGGEERVGFAETRSFWRKEVYRLAVIPVEFPDVKSNPVVPLSEWEEMFFSIGSYAGKTNATGQRVFGSLTDYFLEQSCGALRVEGRVFDWVPAEKKRGDYSQSASSSAKSAFLTEILDTLLAREGATALREFDGLAFIYAGERYPRVTRGSLFWPHRGGVTHKGKRWAYYICPEGGSRMGNISVFCHEFGHMLGLPDLYARPENPGSEGLGAWCAMSSQTRGGQPQHFGAWCKIQMGWLTPTVIDPTEKQKLILGPVLGSTNECFKVLMRPDGSEYLLLENRRRQGFDASLPAEGMLIWHVVGNRPILTESHGVEGPSGPQVFLNSVPYPSSSNDAFTPFTTPSSRSQLGGGLPVHITNIRQLPDGRVTFLVGYEYQ